jgi:hypothetical protein
MLEIIEGKTVLEEEAHKKAEREAKARNNK